MAGSTTVRSSTLVESPEKRAAILDQAIGAFAQDGFRGTDVQAVADNAGVGKGTVYRYFASKENLFWQSTLAVLQRLEAELNQAAAGATSAVDKLRALAHAYASFFASHPQYLELFIQDRAEFRGAGPESHRQYHRALNARYAEIIAAGIATGELRPVDPATTIAAFASLLYGGVALNCYRADNPSLDGVVEYAADVFLDGLRPTRRKDEGEMLKHE